MRRTILWVIVGIVGLLLVIQLVPYGRAHTNPPVTMEPAWDSPQTRELAVRACYDCHSNETAWPWYTSVAPVSWLAQRDVNVGRDVLNFSEWDKPQQKAEDAAEAVREGEMPPIYYTPLHSTARLSDQEKQALIAGLEATIGVSQGTESDD